MTEGWAVLGARDAGDVTDMPIAMLRDVLRPWGTSPSLIGASVACYNPAKDPDGRWGARLTDLLVDVLGTQP